ncbi:MAG: DUF4921 family protein [Actinobacteria bacterium]|nr:DUF4921 family protein [Actinomycetota bacterium]
MNASLPELRVDPLTGLRVLVAGDRAGRPGGLPVPEEPPPIDDANDPFAEGQETRTPLEVWSDRPDGGEANTPGWQVRSVPNLYPALAQKFADGGGMHDVEGQNDDVNAAGSDLTGDQLFAQGVAYGDHEVIVNSPRQVQSLGELGEDELRAALAGWASRMRTHRDNPAVAYPHLCVNEGKMAGASLPHTHAQLYVLPFVPELVERERVRMRDHFERGGITLMQDLADRELVDGGRLVAQDDDAVLLCPFAAATPYRMWIVPRRAEERFEMSEHRGAALLHRAFAALHDALGGRPALNLWVRTSPAGCEGEGFGWRIEIAPRLGQPAGMELGTGVHINAVPPETSAAALREAIR